MATFTIPPLDAAQPEGVTHGVLATGAAMVRELGAAHALLVAWSVVEAAAAAHTTRALGARLDSAALARIGRAYRLFQQLTETSRALLMLAQACADGDLDDVDHAATLAGAAARREPPR